MMCNKLYTGCNVSQEGFANTEIGAATSTQHVTACDLCMQVYFKMGKNYAHWANYFVVAADKAR